MATNLTPLLASAALVGSAPGGMDASDVLKLFRSSDKREAPFATPALTAIDHYRRTAPQLSTGGRPTEDGYRAAAEAGFGLVIDMRGPDEEGVAEEAETARKLGLSRIARPLPDDEEGLPGYLTDLRKLLTDPANQPVLLHCGSGNRVGFVWALLLMQKGVPAELAIGEGRAVGLTSREAELRHLLERDAVTGDLPKD